MATLDMAGSVPAQPQQQWLRYLIVGGLCLAGFYSAFVLYTVDQPLFGVLLIALAVGFAIIFGTRRFYATRFIFPGLAAILIFIAFPVVYTVYLGFTNYSSFNLLTYERAIEVLQSNKTIDKSTEQPFLVAAEGDAYRIYLPDAGLISGPVSLESPESAALEPISGEPDNLLAARDAVRLRSGLQSLDLVLPDGGILKNSGLRTFAAVTPEYIRIDEDHLERTADGMILTANHETGFFVTEDGEQVPPGWRVNVGWKNYQRIFASEGVRAPMVAIFIWTVIFALLSVSLTFAVGLALATILQWPHLKGKPVYRILLILPYAVPSFISILVFKGLFNQNFGEINLILEALFGIRPEWFTNGFLARTMIVIVNVWLGYPYMMLLSMGFLQAVPEDHKKAAALEGASALRVFFTITLPQIIPPFLPLLIAAFAFNFNNLVLILLLTRGGPDIPGTVIPAGETDILGSFTYRISFMDSGQQFGLAGAITFLIFLVVGAIAYANFVAMRRVANRGKQL
ncbi:maltose ABC transporter permease MalF [Cucumibacter marinus]|uniref:maltose ABC transporter permease MalF n=1 Tax=Cucumibacter marinus TaxID=1121252 RepID=UPI0003FFE32C|nr:maltose ABC transporter permease MalF [Cucumibacter marinus]